MSKATKMYQEFLYTKRLPANIRTYNMFLDEIKDYKTFCELERRATNVRTVESKSN